MTGCEIVVELDQECYTAELSTDQVGAELGTAVDVTVVGDPYEGDYTITPRPRSDQVLPTNGKLLDQDLTVLRIPYYQASNPKGDTVYIGSEVQPWP